MNKFENFCTCYNWSGTGASCVACSRVCWNEPLAKRKKIRKFRATTAVKSMARDVLGTPPPERREENKKRNKNQKYKTTLGKLLSDADRM